MTGKYGVTAIMGIYYKMKIELVLVAVNIPLQKGMMPA
jgi:hypothetical protein